MEVLARAAAVFVVLFAWLLFLSVYLVCYRRCLSYAEAAGDLPFRNVVVTDFDDCLAAGAAIKP